MFARDLARNIRKGETLFPLGLFCFVAILFYDTLQAPPRPMLLPKAVQFIMLVMLAIQFLKCLLAKPAETERTEEERAAKRKVTIKLTVTFIGMMLIPFASYVIGFVLTGCLYVLLTILYWGGSKLRHIIIAEVCLLALIYGVFQGILDISFPAGMIFGG